MTTPGPCASAAPANAAEKRVPSGEASSRISAAAAPATRGTSSGSSGGTASNSKHMPLGKRLQEWDDVLGETVELRRSDHRVQVRRRRAVVDLHQARNLRRLLHRACAADDPAV